MTPDNPTPKTVVPTPPASAPSAGSVAVVVHVQVRLDMEEATQKLQLDQVRALFDGITKVLTAQPQNKDISKP